MISYIHAVNIRDLDLNLLRLFEAVYVTGSISQAAEQLGVTQPAASNALRRLRDQIGDHLFVRGATGLTPTRRAEQLIGPVRDALTMLRESLGGSDFDPSQIRRKFRIVMFDPAESVVMPALLARFAAEAPGAALELLPYYGTDILGGLKKQLIDIAFSPFLTDADQLRSKLLVWPTEIACIARRGHPRIDGRLDRPTFDSCGHVVLSIRERALTKIEEVLLAQGCERRIVVEVTKLWSTVAIVSGSDLLGLVPKPFAQKVADLFGLQVLSVPYDLPPAPLFMQWHGSSDNDPEHSWLREGIVEGFEAFMAARRGNGAGAADASEPGRK